MVKHSSRKAVAAALVATLAAAAPALADGTETLGNPSIPIATGTGSVVAGVGTHAFPNTATTLNVNVPAGSLVKQVLVYWEGHVTWPTYTADRRATMVFDESVTVVDAPLEAERAVWASYAFPGGTAR